MAYAKGLPDIKSINYDEDFLICHEWFFLCGYVPKLPNNQVSKLSGVTIGIGVDLGRKTEKELTAMKINMATISKLSPYLGLRGADAVSMLKAYKNLTLTETEAFELSRKVKDYYLRDLSDFYNNLKKAENATQKFNDLHLSIKTALFSLYYNRPKLDYKGLREALSANNWAQAADIIEALKSNRSRRKAEALLLRSFRIKCQNEMYISVLMDESGSISQGDFRKEIAFVSDLISKQHAAENQKVFISLVTFSNSARVHCDFTNNRSTLQSALNSISQLSGGTNTGEAIFTARSLFLKTDSYINSNLDARIIIVITDGQSNDRAYTLQQAETSRKSGIQIISVGVGESLNLSELNDMSGGNKNVMLIDDFSSLSASLENLSAGVCTQTSPIESNKTFSSSLENLNSPIYMQIEKSKSSNQRFTVEDKALNSTLGDSKLIICASYNDPYPNEISNELCHYGNNKGVKELVMESKEKALEKDKGFDDFDADFNFESFLNVQLKSAAAAAAEENKNLRILENEDGNSTAIAFVTAAIANNENEKEILYLSVKGRNVNFTINAQECDPKICPFGTNDLVSGSETALIVLLIVLMTVIVLGGLFALHKFTANRDKYKKEHQKQENISDVSKFDYGKLSS